MQWTHLVMASATFVLLATAGAMAQESSRQAPVAGTTPDRRPEGAPVVRQTGFTMFGLATALEGISQPYPKNLDFLDDQGAWFTPFTRPGMRGPYDIRGLHKKPSHGSAR